MQKKWIITIIVSIILLALAVLGFVIYAGNQVVVVKYGTPNYRPKVE